MKKIWIFLMCLLPTVAFSMDVGNEHALLDLPTIKIVWDVNVGDAKLLLRRLEMIDETYTQLMDAGVATTMVVAFRGEASRYVTRGAKYVEAEQEPTKTKIQGWIRQFSENGFRLEQCAIAARTWRIDPADFLPEVRLVQNGYISLAAYQNKGYALVPMD